MAVRLDTQRGEGAVRVMKDPHIWMHCLHLSDILSTNLNLPDKMTRERCSSLAVSNSLT